VSINATGEAVETRKKQTRAARAVKEAGAESAPQAGNDIQRC
jgi:hypothetical protein